MPYLPQCIVAAPPFHHLPHFHPNPGPTDTPTLRHIPLIRSAKVMRLDTNTGSHNHVSSPSRPHVYEYLVIRGDTCGSKTASTGYAPRADIQLPQAVPLPPVSPPVKMCQRRSSSAKCHKCLWMNGYSYFNDGDKCWVCNVGQTSLWLTVSSEK